MRTSFRTACALTAVGIFAAACGTAEPSTSGSGTDSSDFANSIDVREGWNPDAHFTWANGTFATTWDPIASNTGGDIPWFSQIYDTLLALDLDGSLRPMLATEWEPSADNSSVVLTLRDDAQFSDGTPLDAEAVKFNLDRARGADSKIASEIAQIQDVTVIDPLTVEINVDGGLGALLTALTARGGMMVSPTAAAAGNLSQEPVGSGPYTVTSIVPEDRAELTKSPDYWDPDAQRVASMTIRSISDNQARLNALQSGEVDGATMAPDQLDTASGMDLQVISEPSTAFIYFMVNTAKEPFDDVRIRLALNHAVDREGIAEGLYQGHCTPSIRPWPESSVAYSEEIGDGLDVFDYNPQKARDLLKEAGVESLEMTSVSVNVPTYVKLAEVIQQNLKDVGIDLTITQAPTNEVIAAFVTDQTADANINPYSGFSDPHGVIARNFMPDSLFNVGAPMPQEMLDVAIQAADPVDPAERLPRYEEFMHQWIENPPYMMSICMQHNAAAYTSRVSGVSQDLSGWATYRGVALSD